MSLLTKLTLVIPTYNRQGYVLRHMRYWSGSSVTVHVLDGGAQPIPAEEMAELAANVNYHHLPISIWDRFGKAVDLVQTEYAALLGDDEFFLAQALQACIQELEADKTLVSCMGRCLAFRPVSKGVIGWPAYTEMANYAVLQDNPIARMIHHMNPYTCSTIYSVVRAPVWRQAMAILSKKQFLVYSLEELQFELSVCYQGKSKVIQNLMWLRSGENDGFRDEREIVRFDEWWVDKKKANDREEFLTLMANMLAHSDTGRTEAVREGVAAACEAYLDFCKQYAHRSFLVRLRAIVAKSLPRTVKSGIRKARSFLRGRHQSSGTRTLLEAARDIETTGVRVDFDQLSQVNKLIEQFHAAPSNQAELRLTQ